jgi:hypothetical protein
MLEFWVLIAAILVDAVLCVILGTLRLYARTSRRSGAPADPLGADLDEADKKGRRHFLARLVFVPAALGLFSLFAYSSWRLGLFDGVVEGTPLWTVALVVVMGLTSLLSSATLGQIIALSGNRRTPGREPYAPDSEAAWTPEAPVWQHSEELRRETAEQELTGSGTPARTRRGGCQGILRGLALLSLIGFLLLAMPFLGVVYLNLIKQREYLKSLYPVLLFSLFVGLLLFLLAVAGAKKQRRRGRGQRRPGVDYLWDKIVEEPPVPAEIPDWVRQLAPPEVGRGM